MIPNTLQKNVHDTIPQASGRVYVTLPSRKPSPLPSRKQLLDALRRSFPEGTVTLGVETTSKDVLDYWHLLQEDYRSSADGEERICFATSFWIAR